jgi:hypothetical protein
MVCLAECAQYPIMLSILLRATRFWNKLCQANGLLAAVRQEAMHQPWVTTLKDCWQALDTDATLDPPTPIDVTNLENKIKEKLLQMINTDARASTATYIHQVRGGPITPNDYTTPEYLRKIKDKKCRKVLSQYRTGGHYLGSCHRGGHDHIPGLPPDNDTACRECCWHGIITPETVTHRLLECPMTHQVRNDFRALFGPSIMGPNRLKLFLEQDPIQVAHYCTRCDQQHPIPREIG